jgi:hypothetical protein
MSGRGTLFDRLIETGMLAANCGDLGLGRKPMECPISEVAAALAKGSEFTKP